MNETEEKREEPEMEESNTDDGDKQRTFTRDICPDCFATLRRESACKTCPACGWSACG